ncbi:hypothetical protein BU26DRAFT_523575 [Trematosphaeria pertusa]|uniref:Uncharacterized protein n=1 Tax=Trematosphaeria pertusa TaxID=390896 RepID=A0A6A6HYC7_9PLEO|nr:uncharacterized protein BU26DRAFT_523575 [Trematosphaeria pertusa]KAF2243234.1 hypothetical protein BU26DRAFT_523575 [Trematosphaeria pertusa]
MDAGITERVKRYCCSERMCGEGGGARWEEEQGRRGDGSVLLSEAAFKELNGA